MFQNCFYLFQSCSARLSDYPIKIATNWESLNHIKTSFQDIPLKISKNYTTSHTCFFTCSARPRLSQRAKLLDQRQNDVVRLLSNGVTPVSTSSIEKPWKASRLRSCWHGISNTKHMDSKWFECLRVALSLALQTHSALWSSIPQTT